jgi:threonine/homoserine/homoserine lactone efflux protein
MMGALKQTGMVAVLVLLSEGFFVLSGVLWHGDASRPGAKSTARTEFVEIVAGAILCSSAVMLLYSLGTRDEK